MESPCVRPATRGSRSREEGGARSPSTEEMRGRWWPTPPIVDQETLERANSGVRTASILERVKCRLLRGMVFCGVCGRTMTTQTVKRGARSRYEFYWCMAGWGTDPTTCCGNGRTQIAHADRGLEAGDRTPQGSRVHPRPDRWKHTPRPGPGCGPLLPPAAIAKAEDDIKRLVDRLGEEEDEIVAGAVREKLNPAEHHRATTRPLRNCPARLGGPGGGPSGHSLAGTGGGRIRAGVGVSEGGNERMRPGTHGEPPGPPRPGAGGPGGDGFLRRGSVECAIYRWRPVLVRLGRGPRSAPGASAIR